MNLLNTLAGIAGQKLKGPEVQTVQMYAPALYGSIRTLARDMGYARAWSKVAHDSATLPVYEWLLTADMMMQVMGDTPTLWDYREHWDDLVELSDLAVAVFGPALPEGHESRHAFDLIVWGLKAIRGVK